jgi:hypothetical protein
VVDDCETVFAAGYGATVGPTRPRAQPAAGPAYTLQSLTLFVPSKVRAWLAARPRYHVHYTPTYSSWLNQVERWFGLITQQSIRRGSFRNVKELVQRIDTYVKHHNHHASPFQWTATADSILGKIERLSKVISGTQH